MGKMRIHAHRSATNPMQSMQAKKTSLEMTRVSRTTHSTATKAPPVTRKHWFCWTRMVIGKAAARMTGIVVFSQTARNVFMVGR